MAPTTHALVHRPFSFALVVLLCVAGSRSHAADAVEDAGDGTRLVGAVEVTCTPDEKSKAAGDTAFDDTITFDNDRVESKALGERGFPKTLSIPRTVNGVLTMTVAFKKRGGGEKATYLLRRKKDGTISGTLTIVEGKTRHRYLVRDKGAPAPTDPDSGDTAAAGKPGKSKRGKSAKDATEPAVIRVDGGFVRLMTTNVALTEARITDKARKAKVTEIQNAAGADWQALKGTYLSGAISAAEYTGAAGRRLDEANRELKAALGDAIGDLEAAYAKPTAAEFLYHNALRAALAELDSPKKTAAAEKAVYQGMLDLAKLVRNPAGREPDVLAKFRELTDARVKKALPAAEWTRVRKMVEALTSYRPTAENAGPPPIDLQ